MNIEEERKVFEGCFPPPSYVYWSNEYGRYLTKHNHSSCAVHQGSYAGWLAAKAHAEEMARPVLSVAETRHGKWGLYIPSYYRALEIRESREAAVQWAKDNGYRVVSE